MIILRNWYNSLDLGPKFRELFCVIGITPKEFAKENHYVLCAICLTLN